LGIPIDTFYLIHRGSLAPDDGRITGKRGSIMSVSAADDDSTSSSVVLLLQLFNNCRGNVGRYSTIIYGNQDHRVFIADAQGPRPDPLVYIDMFARSTTIAGEQDRMLRSDVNLCGTNASPPVFGL